MNHFSKLILTAQQIDEMPAQRKVHFLNARAIRQNKSLGDAVGLGHIGVHQIEVAPGDESTAFHMHRYEEECIYVLSGQASLRMGDETYSLGPGDFVGFPRNTVAHGLKNTGDVPLVCLVMGQRLEHDITEYPELGKRLYRNSGHWDLVDTEQVSDPKANY